MGARSVSVCEKSFSLREEFRITRSVWDWEKCFGFVRIGRLSNWDVRVSVIFEIETTHFVILFFEDTKNNHYLVKMQCVNQNQQIFSNLKYDYFCKFFKAGTASINGN